MPYCVMVMQVTTVSQFLLIAKGSHSIPTTGFKLLQNDLPQCISAEHVGNHALANPTDFCYVETFRRREWASKRGSAQRERRNEGEEETERRMRKKKDAREGDDMVKSWWDTQTERAGWGSRGGHGQRLGLRFLRQKVLCNQQRSSLPFVSVWVIQKGLNLLQQVGWKTKQNKKEKRNLLGGPVRTSRLNSTPSDLKVAHWQDVASVDWTHKWFWAPFRTLWPFQHTRRPI